MEEQQSWIVARRLKIFSPYGISVHDMDRSWRDGIAFNALIHRAKPELVDMEQVRRSQPRDNLEQVGRHILTSNIRCCQTSHCLLSKRFLGGIHACGNVADFQAFRLARDYLQIRPLLDVEDMLCEKPDKRSVITYVSQFIRSPSLVCPIAAGPVMDDRSLLLWVESTLLTLRDSSAAPVLDQYQVRLSHNTFKEISYYSLFIASLFCSCHLKVVENDAPVIRYALHKFAFVKCIITTFSLVYAHLCLSICLVISALQVMEFYHKIRQI